MFVHTVVLDFSVERGDVEEHIIIVLVLLIYDIISNAVSGREKRLGREHALVGSNALARTLDCRLLALFFGIIYSFGKYIVCYLFNRRD